MAKQGLFIVYEGPDKMFLDSQADTLAYRLLMRQEEPVARLSFPSKKTGPIQDLWKKFVNQEIKMTVEAAHAILIAEIWERKAEIETYRKNGVNIISDGYVFGSIAHSMAAGLETNFCARFAEGLPKPDRVILIDRCVDSEIAQARNGYSRFEQPEFQEELRKQFHELRDLADCNNMSKWMVIPSVNEIADLGRDTYSLRIAGDIFNEIEQLRCDGIREEGGLFS